MEKTEKLNGRYCFYIFWFLFLIENLCSILAYFLDAVGPQFHLLKTLFKLPIILQMLVACYYVIVRKKKINLNVLSIAFCSFLPLGVLVGIANAQMNQKFLVHIYSYLMPVIVMSFAVNFYAEYQLNNRLQKYFRKIINIGVGVYTLFTLLFNVLYQAGMLRHNNYGAGMGTLGLPFFLGGGVLM